MSKVTFSVACSLDGYQTDSDGDYSWAEPSDEVISAINEDLRDVSTYLYGRRMYQEMAVWETDPALAAQSPELERFAEAWKAADKVVFSRSLESVWTERTRLERELTTETLRAAKYGAQGNLTIEGPILARSALERGMVDEVELLLCPIIVGGGSPVFPAGVFSKLELTRERRFDNGMVQVRYDVLR